MPLLGRHMPLDAKPLEALKIARRIGCDAIQFFVSNPRGWTPPEIAEDDRTAFAQALREAGFGHHTIHAPYLINLASESEETRRKSESLLVWTLQYGQHIGVHTVVVHIGSHGGAGTETGIRRLIYGVTAVMAEVETSPMLLLENDVGAGHTVGSRFETMAAVIAGLSDDVRARVGVCVDTAHLWGAGYDIGTPESATAVLDGITAVLDQSLIQVIHLNDTKVALGSHRDVHARLGEGIIGLEGLRAFLRDPRLDHTVILMETPIVEDAKKHHDWEDDARRVAFARSLLTDPTD